MMNNNFVNNFHKLTLIFFFQFYCNNFADNGYMYLDIHRCGYEHGYNGCYSREYEYVYFFQIMDLWTRL
jgi:hypothetical protein